MTILKLVSLIDPVLRRPTKGVSRLTSEHHKLIVDMIETVLDTGGLGLSANQVGSPWRIAVINLGSVRPEEKIPPVILINPRILAKSEKYTVEEGCLSIPGYKGTVKRFQTITFRGMGKEWEPFRVEVHGLLAHVVQHEVDHLDGKLYIDRLISEEAT